MLTWGAHLYYSLSSVPVSFKDPFMYLNILIQAYLYTGLFITAHDAMHGSISPDKKINDLTGKISAFLFAGLSYKKLLRNHRDHHTYPGTGKDPDYYTGSRNFFVWWFVFMSRYISVLQLIIMAVIFNVLKIYFPESSIWTYLVIPAFLSTLQLFYFGTYLPHRQPHTHDMQPHNARTQKRNHFFAMISCYFFGYHSEHHSSPKTPWWKMYTLK
ncbi:MAG TPA: fatty acid desaturase [Ignavibacteria bacterium]|nr:fatty acid desaturase [Ignavibacteria bacterium]HMR40740.1 fatty acid desaturase [Ignavibacteria bacterium]